MVNIDRLNPQEQKLFGVLEFFNNVRRLETSFSSNSRITELEITTKGTLGPSDKKKVIGSVSPAGYK